MSNEQKFAFLSLLYATRIQTGGSHYTLISEVRDTKLSRFSTIFHNISCRFFTFAESWRLYRYVLVAIDSFSLYSMLLPARTNTSEETARLL